MVIGFNPIFSCRYWKLINFKILPCKAFSKFLCNSLYQTRYQLELWVRLQEKSRVISTNTFLTKTQIKVKRPQKGHISVSCSHWRYYYLPAGCQQGWSNLNTQLNFKCEIIICSYSDFIRIFLNTVIRTLWPVLLLEP